MAIKRQVHEKCAHCREVIARTDGVSVWFGGHICKVKPVPSMQEPPRRVRAGSVNFIPAVNIFAAVKDK